MRFIVFVTALAVAGPAFAQGKTDCAQQAEIVMGAVEARADGQSKRKTRATLNDALGKDAAKALADWIYTLEPEQLTDDVGKAYKVQCEAL